MKNTYSIKIEPHLSFDEMWNYILSKGGIPLYSITDENNDEMIIYEAKVVLPMSEKFNLPSIDWDQQWSQSPYYKGNKIEFDMKEFGASVSIPITLYPGEGFGDLSHPTTQLMLELIAKEDVSAYPQVVDAGCGSGILSIILAKMKAKEVVGFDIDPHAITHSNKNKRLNHIKQNLHFYVNADLPPKFLKENNLFIINMIFSEQIMVLEEYIGKPKTIISSGILVEEQGEYIKFMKKFGLTPIKQLTRGIWTSFKLTINI